jgi:hypothetical protein
MCPQELQASGYQETLLPLSVLEGIRDRTWDCWQYQASESGLPARILLVPLWEPSLLRLHGKWQSLGSTSW